MTPEVLIVSAAMLAAELQTRSVTAAMRSAVAWAAVALATLRARRASR